MKCLSCVYFGQLNLSARKMGLFSLFQILCNRFFAATSMFITKFSRLGTCAIRGLTPATCPIHGGRFTQRIPSYSPVHYSSPLQLLKNQLLSSNAADKSLDGKGEEEKIAVTFVDKDGEEKEIKVPIGMSMLEAAHENDIDLEGACEASLACSTCHVIVMDMEYYNKLEEPADEENDMLDLAFGLTETSRLGCQVIAKPELDGIRLAIPAATRNFAVDGYKPKPH